MRMVRRQRSLSVALLLFLVTNAAATTTAAWLSYATTGKRSSAAAPLYSTSNEFQHVEHDSTVVTLKMAFDQQWAVADSSERSERFTSPKSLDLVHRLRAQSDGVLVGRGTVQADDCSLTVRRGVQCEIQPVRIVIDSKLTLLTEDEKEYKIFSDGLPTILYHEYDKRMSGLSEDLVGLERGPSGLLSTKAILADLQSRDIHRVMVEGGPATALSFLEDRAIDRAILIFAPIVFNQPYPSGINQIVLQESGLEKLGYYECDGDRVECWSRPSLPWPTEALQDWP